MVFSCNRVANRSSQRARPHEYLEQCNLDSKRGMKRISEPNKIMPNIHEKRDHQNTSFLSFSPQQTRSNWPAGNDLWILNHRPFLNRRRLVQNSKLSERGTQLEVWGVWGEAKSKVGIVLCFESGEEEEENETQVRALGNLFLLSHEPLWDLGKYPSMCGLILMVQQQPCFLYFFLAAYTCKGSENVSM